MDSFTRNTNIFKKLLIVIPIIAIAFFVADAVYINQFNSESHVSQGSAEDQGAYLSFEPRKDSTAAWKKRDFELNGKTVDLKAQTYDGVLTNQSDYELGDWSFTLQIKGDCFVNNAWCGTMEIHQNVGTSQEKVQTLDLRDYDKKDVTLDYLYDGDLLIPLSAGDYIVYHPSEEDDELPVAKMETLKTGLILYYLEKPDLTDYAMSYQYHRAADDCTLFRIGAVIGIIWLLLLAGYVVMRVTYRMATREMEMKKSGVSAMSDIYSIIYIIDLKSNELMPVLADKESEKLRPKDLGAQEQLRDLFEWDCAEEYKDVVLSFCDLDTVRDRIRGRNTLVCEYFGKSHGWCQLRFFTMDRNDQGEAEKLIFAIQVVNDEKVELESLNAQVKEKTESIVQIQQKVVVGLANIIENRDNNTGGHVKRTSDVIGIVVEEIQKQGNVQIDAGVARDIVRAAPMHDLGKISIDSSILCKPGRLTDEEFATMKTHSAKSGEMVQILLDGVEEDHFVQIAFNVARHHHERWDGRGYPDGLKGEEIPIEARIMAIADVYDALVSKRCYKEPMSFEQAYNVMMEGMGSQFDPQMKDVFQGCHEKLEDYYRAAK